jgi:hypothetical protein
MRHRPAPPRRVVVARGCARATSLVTRDRLSARQGAAAQSAGPAQVARTAAEPRSWLAMLAITPATGTSLVPRHNREPRPPWLAPADQGRSVAHRPPLDAQWHAIGDRGESAPTNSAPSAAARTSSRDTTACQARRDHTPRPVSPNARASPRPHKTTHQLANHAAIARGLGTTYPVAWPSTSTASEQRC